MAKLVWRVKLVTELQAGETTEIEVKDGRLGRYCVSPQRGARIRFRQLSRQ